MDKKLKVTAEAGYNGRDNTNLGRVRTEQLLGGDKRNIEEQQNYSFSRSQNGEVNGRLEWTPSKKTTLIFDPSLEFNWRNSEEKSSFSTNNNSGNRINEGTSESNSRSSGYNFNGRLHFSHAFNEQGRNLYTQVFTRYSNDSGDGFTRSSTRFFTGREDLVRDQKNDNHSSNFSIFTRISYLEPFNDRWALQLGYHFNLSKRENDRASYNKDASGAYTLLDPDYSRGSQNSSLSQQMQARLRYSFAKSNISADFSANPTTTHIISSQGREVTFDKRRTVWNFSPTLILDLRPNDSISINLRYNGRTSQPSMEQLNPATIIISPLAQTTGNPNLLPAFSHNVWVGSNFAKRSKRQSFSLNGGWSFTQNSVATKQIIDPATGSRTTTYENIDGNQNLRAGFMINTPIGSAKSKWTSFTFGHVMYSKEKGFVNGELNSANVWRPNLSQRISWNGSWLQATVGGFVAIG